MAISPNEQTSEFQQQNKANKANPKEKNREKYVH